jgi:hypothetical protein
MLTQWHPGGLERGIFGSRATHTSVKEYYALVTQPPELTLDMATIHHQLVSVFRQPPTTNLSRNAKFLRNVPC